MRRGKGACVFTTFVACVAACGGGSGGGAGGSDGLQADGGPACNTVAALAPFIDRVDFEGPGPSPEGGQIADGTYFLTQYNMYYAPKSAGDYPYHVSSTIVVSGNVLERVQIANGGGARTSSQFRTDGMKFDEKQTCNSGYVLSGFALTYTATPTTLKAYLFVGGILHEEIFTKQ